LLMAFVTLASQAWAIKNGLHWQTIVFNVLCLSQIGHVLAIRSEKQSFFSTGIFSNKMLIASVVLALILQFVLTYVPFLHPVFQTESLTLKEFTVVCVLSSLVFFAVETEKMFSRRRIRMNTVS
jgi:P-type Ca2+ transporter type 2C